MNARLLIDAIVRQTTVLVAQIATSGGLRAPLAHLANEVFLDLARELEAQGVSRKVGADMFGMALRAYIRKVQRLEESRTDQGRSLRSAIYEYLQETGTVSRRDVLDRFRRDDEAILGGMLRDLTESGLVFVTRAGLDTIYRAATEEERSNPSITNQGRIDELLWALVFAEGPMDVSRIDRLGGLPRDEVHAALERLVGAKENRTAKTAPLPNPPAERRGLRASGVAVGRVGSDIRLGGRRSSRCNLSSRRTSAVADLPSVGKSRPSARSGSLSER